MYYLYKITCLVNKKLYIGQTTNPTERWKYHCSDAAKAKYPLHRAMKKYGINNFTFEVIAECLTLSETNQLEIDLIKYYKSNVLDGQGYNIEEGGGNRNDKYEWGECSY